MQKLFHISETASTNDEISNFITSTNDDFTALFTLNQTKGKGQYGNVWQSEPEQNIAYTLAVKTKNFLVSGNLINYYTATILRDFVANLTNRDTKIKWPNDIILNGKKVSGMLIERKKIFGNDYYIIGIGININQQNFENLPKASSIFVETGKTFDLMDISEQLHLLFLKNLKKNINEIEIIEIFNEHLFKKNEVAVFEIEKTRQNGIIKSADKDGFLWVELENLGLKKFYHKEIELLY